MEIKKKANRWLLQIQRCQEQTKAIVAQTDQDRNSAAFLAHCSERLEFLAAREQLLSKRMRRLHRQLVQEEAEAGHKLLNKIFGAARQHGKVVLTSNDGDSVKIKILNEACPKKK